MCCKRLAREERELTDARWAVLEPLLPRNALAPVDPTRTTAKSWKRSCGCNYLAMVKLGAALIWL
jgi:hypothetical protein